VVTERIVAGIERRDVDHKHGDYLGKVMCFFEIGDGKGALLQFDHEHPPRPPKPNQLWHLDKIVFNKNHRSAFEHSPGMPSDPLDVTDGSGPLGHDARS
jgi:hypothetical protein